jgi:hypothetical protein
MKKLMKGMSVTLLIGFMMYTTATKAQNISKDEIIGEWKFVEISLVSPKAGHVLPMGLQEMNQMKMAMANYNFNQDGTIAFSEEYLKNNNYESASWKLDGSSIFITYKITDGSIGFKWNVASVSKEELVLDWMRVLKIKLTK